MTLADKITPQKIRNCFFNSLSALYPFVYIPRIKTHSCQMGLLTFNLHGINLF
jgi:hypothetical protein